MQPEFWKIIGLGAPADADQCLGALLSELKDIANKTGRWVRRRSDAATRRDAEKMRQAFQSKNKTELWVLAGKHLNLGAEKYGKDEVCPVLKSTRVHNVIARIGGLLLDSI